MQFNGGGIAFLTNAVEKLDCPWQKKMNLNPPLNFTQINLQWVTGLTEKENHKTFRKTKKEKIFRA